MNWSHCCSKFNYISIPKDKNGNSKNKNHSFSLKILKLDFPIDFLRNDNESFFIRASLFDFTSKEFIGKQWNSSRINKFKKVNDICNIDLNEALYFHTSVIDESLVLIFEIIRYTSEQDQTSLCWSIFNIFKSTNNPVEISSKKPSETMSLGLLKGSPRALQLMNYPPEKYPGLQQYEKSFLHVTFNTNQSFDQCQYLVPENFLLHDNDKLPGLETGSDGKVNFSKPLMKKYTDYFLEKLNVIVEPSLFEFENNFKKLLNADYLLRDNATLSKDLASLTIVERRLRVGVHNGYTFVEDNDTVCLNVHDSKVKSHRTSHTVKSASNTDNLLKAKNAVEISLPEDSNFALIFFLEYIVSESKVEEKSRQSTGMTPSTQHTYQMGWALYQPFNQDISPNSFDNGIKLELDFSGGTDHAPDDVLIYRAEALSNGVSSKEGDNVEYSGNIIKLSAVFRTKITDEKEPEIIVKRNSMSYSAIPFEPIVTLSELHENPKHRTVDTIKEVKHKVKREQKEQRDENLILSNQPSATKSEIYEAQVRQYQQFIMQQQMQQRWFDQGPFQISPIFLGKPSIQTDEGIVNYKDIEPYVISQDSHPSARGRSSNMLPLQMRVHSGLGFSRATYASMNAAGFTDFLDCNGNHPFVIEPNDQDNDINWLLEERDPKDCDGIIFQFIALSRFDSIGNIQTKSVFFTFQFYRFPHVSTERLKLEGILDNASNYEKSVPMILRKASKDGSTTTDPPGATVKYMLNPSYMKHGERYTFLEYMSQQVMYIDVWDGDSLMLIGNCAVRLKNICRQGKPSVQMTYELDIINPEDLEESNISSIKGRLHLRLINLGSTSTDKRKNMTLTAYPKKGLLVDTTEMENFNGGSISMVSSHLSGSLKNIYKTEDVEGDCLHYSGVVVRPQPAASKHRELAEMLESKSSPKGSTPMSSTRTPLMNDNVLKGMDHDKSKKLSRLKSLIETLPNTYDNSEDNKLLLEASRNDKADKIKSLQIIQNFRNQQKKENIRLMLSGVIQKEMTLYPKFGTTEIFEVKIKNHFNHETNIQIEIIDENDCLAVVVNPHELKALKNLYSITTSSENGLISSNKPKGCPEIFMRPKESVLVPFKYTNMTFHGTQVIQEPSVEGSATTSLNKQSVTDIEKQIIFRTSDGNLISMVRVKVFPRPVAIDQTFRFFHPEQSFLKKIIRLPPIHVIAGPNDAMKALTRCSDETVVTECQQVPVGTPNDVFIKINCGPHPEVRQFLLAVYVDKFLLKPIQVWHFTINSQKRVDVVAYQGQTTHFTLLVKGSSNTHRVQVFSSDPKELSVGQMDTNVFTLVAHNTCELNLSLTPLKIGSRTFHVNVVDVDSHKLVMAWSICAICKEPEVSKMFELEMPANGGEECKKKIGYQNPYGRDKRFFILTDRQDLIMFKDSIINISANKVEYIGIIFLPVITRGKRKIFVFINDEDGKNEETFSLLVNYV